MNRAACIALLIALLMVSCVTKRIEHTTQSDVVSIVRDTVRDSIVYADSVYILDSVFVMSANDTVYQDRWHTEIRYKDRWRDRWHDVYTTDTITKIQTESVYIEKKLTPWQRLQIWFGRMFIIAALVIASIVVLKSMHMI